MKKDSKHRKSRLIDRHRNHDHLKLCDWDIKSMGCSVLQHNAVCCSVLQYGVRDACALQHSNNLHT